MNYLVFIGPARPALLRYAFEKYLCNRMQISLHTLRDTRGACLARGSQIIIILQVFIG